MPDAEVRTILSAEDRASPVVKDYEGTLAGLGQTIAGNQGKILGMLNVGRLAITTFQRLEIASLALENAHDRVTLAQDRLRHAVEKYGPASEQARDAQRELDIANRSLEISQQRLNVRMAFMAVTIIPEVVATILSLARAWGTVKVAADAATASQTVAAVAGNVGGGAGLLSRIMGGVGGIRGVAALAGAASLIGGGIMAMTMQNLAQSQGLNVYGDVNIHGGGATEMGDRLASLRSERR